MSVNFGFTSSSILKDTFWRRITRSIKLLKKVVRSYRLNKTISTYFFAQAILAFTRLRIAEYLKDEAKSSQALATEMNADVNSLDLLLRLLAQSGIIASDRQGNYNLTAVGQRLRSDSSHSLYGSIRSMADLIGPSWSNLDYTVKTGKAAFDKTFGADFYEYIQNHPEAKTIFNEWMKETIQEWFVPTLNMCDLSEVKTLVDVGGNIGILTRVLLQQYPYLKAIIFDQPHLADDAKKILESSGVSDRAQFIGGDFFDSVPSGGDLYIISRVLDNWDDERALKILKNCRVAMPTTAKLLIMDSVQPEKEGNHMLLIGSLHVLVMGAGVVRTKSQYYNLLEQAGFHVVGFAQTEGLASFIEAAPIS